MRTQAASGRDRRVLVLVAVSAVAATVAVLGLVVWRAHQLTSSDPTAFPAPVPSHAAVGCPDAAVAAAARAALVQQGSDGARDPRTAGVSAFRCTSEHTDGDTIELTARADVWGISSERSTPTLYARSENRVDAQITLVRDGATFTVVSLSSDFVPGYGP